MTEQRVLPPNIDEVTLEAFFDNVSSQIGASNVSRDHTFGAPKGPHGQYSYGIHSPLHVITARVFIVKAANRFRIPLWTVSRGKNLGYGGSSPVVRGSVVLDLHRMKKIIEINEEYAYAIVEPGVTFFDLYETVKKRGLKLWPSVPSLGWGSIVGNTLERGFGYTPEGEHSQMQCGMEVVLPNGELVRTGMGAMEGNKCFALFKGGLGPSVDGLFFQSNLGVVTKMGIHCTPAPEAYIKCEVSVPREEDLVSLVGISTDLLRRRILSNSPGFANIVCLAMAAAAAGDVIVRSKVAPYVGKTAIPDRVLKEIQTTKEWPWWVNLFSLFGPRDLVEAQLVAVKRAFSKIPGAVVTAKLHTCAPGQVLNPEVIGEEPEILPQTGRPTLHSLSMLNFRENGAGHVAFAPVIPPSGRELYEWYLKAKKLTMDAGFDFVADFHLWARYAIPIDLVMFKSSEQAKMRALLKDLTDMTVKLGYSEYRTHVSFMDEVASHHNFNNGAMAKLTSAFKDFLDPNGILSPGKSGVWNSSRPSPKL
ncbi:vanillyl-alcohol oxidase [Delitschia confertaspora ATCC 74209]|uniref:Vanillyl-alcohol oxidase n=1 Tax=Delitschia confertaspora ATCC 74209 TaxID=1513339 RepID=A0A9P4JSQ4_9PLEO|nr:vanillyl-alcohol oxidase [Delitschia confertaspora ATCC 74209]